MHPDWLIPTSLGEGVGALMTARGGGVSRAPFDSLNLGLAAGDDPQAVRQNREMLAEAIGAVPVFMRQVHGTRVARLGAGHLRPGAAVEEADASVTTEPGLACTVLVADCLPVLMAAPHGHAVAAAHAGWRGLSGGVVEATLRELCIAAGCEPAEVRAWLGACIGPRRFEVGSEVLEAFGADPRDADPARFAEAPAVNGGAKWVANLVQLAIDRLVHAGVVDVAGGRWCTVEDASRFFSFRRDRVTGRMAAAVWIRR
jgi:YfiH family protein